MSWREAWRLPPDVPIWQWAEGAITISPRNPSAFPGPYRSDLTPYARGIFDAIKDRTIHTITVEKGAQTGLTLTGHIALCYYIAEDPCPILLVMPSTDLARSASETRLQPLLEDSPRLRRELMDDPDAFKKLEYRTKRAVVNLIGGNSPGNLSSRPVRVLFIDEADKLPQSTGDEAGAIPLAVERTKTFWNRKILIFSTPTVPRAYTHQSYQRGDQRRYFVPCHSCGHMQFLQWSGVKFDSDKPVGESSESAHYACESCGAAWDDMQKQAAVRAGEWRPTATATDKGHASFHISSLYAPWVTWGGLVTKWLNAQGSPSDLQNFINSDLGEPWEDTPKANVERRTIYQFKDALRFSRGSCPHKGPIKFVLCCDLMDRFAAWSIWGLAERDMYLVDHGRVSTLDDAEPLMDRRVYMSGSEVPIFGLMMDTGYKTNETYAFCRRLFRRFRVVPIKGDSGTATTQTEPLRFTEVGANTGDTLPLCHLHPTFWHHEALDALAAPVVDEGQTLQDALERRRVRVWFHSDIDREYVDELTAEALVESQPDKMGGVKRAFKKLRRNNHQFDCFRYAIAARYMLKNELTTQIAQQGTRKAGAYYPN